MTTLSPKHTSWHSWARWIWVAAALLAVAGVSLMARPRQPAQASLAERWGIDKLRVVRTGAGHLLDFRYRVVDAQKAAPLLARGSKPIAIDEKSGARLGVPSTPKAGALRSHSYGRPKQGRTYFALFANHGGLVKRGDQVSVVIGSFKAPHLIVE